MKAVIANLMTKEMQAKHREKELQREEALIEVTRKEQEQKRLKSKLEHNRLKDIDKEIELAREDRNIATEKLETIPEPVSINLDVDIASSATRYQHLKTNTQEAQQKSEEADKDTYSKWRIFLAEIGVAMLIVFIVTRIASGNGYLLKKITALKISKIFFPHLHKFSALSIDLFIQDFLMMTFFIIVFGTLFRDHAEYRSNTMKPKLLIALVISLTGMLIASFLSLL